MTAKEKEWIIRLQMIQLQSENPYHEDYYYQEYYRRIEAKMAEEELGIKSKREPPKLTTPYITKTDAYAPVVHIEGSLGQVAVSTCYSPRRAISAVHAVQEQKDNKQQGDFLPFLLISKGKRLLARLLPFLKHESAGKILHVVICNLPTLMNKDSEEVGFFLIFCMIWKRNIQKLPLKFPLLHHMLRGSTQLPHKCHFRPNVSVCMGMRNFLLFQFGLSLLYALLSHGEKLLSSGVPLEPSIGDFEMWTEIIFQVAGQLSQCSLVEPLLLPSNLLTLFCRYLDKRTVHQLKNNME
uniref:PAT1 homolog 2 n=1 Tax=Gouania willdenowi TaxID=441366 RepID=A0A8C5HQ67_GOUWI